MFFLITFAFGVYSIDLLDLITDKSHNCLDILTYEEKPCTTMRTGKVRKNSEEDELQICSNKMWQPYPLGRHNNRVPGLIGHWKMDEVSGTNVADDSGYENHGSAGNGPPIPQLSKFSYGRYFNGNGIITIPDAVDINFGTSSFSVSGWQKISSLDYPLTNFAVKKGNGCHYAPDAGVFPGWDIGHGFKSNSLNVCIRDHNNAMVRKYIQLDDGYQPIGQWVHYIVVFDREHHKKAFVYINGKKQSNSMDISSVLGSVDNPKDLEFGSLYGWKTKGTLDDYRMYNRALHAHEVESIYHNHLA